MCSSKRYTSSHAGTLVLDPPRHPPPPPRISVPGGACHIPTPWNFRNIPTWLGTPWTEYFCQKC